MKDELPVYYSSSELCNALGISRSTLQFWDRTGITIPLRINRVKRYKKEDVLRLLKECGSEDSPTLKRVTPPKVLLPLTFDPVSIKHCLALKNNLGQPAKPITCLRELKRVDWVVRGHSVDVRGRIPRFEFGSGWKAEVSKLRELLRLTGIIVHEGKSWTVEVPRSVTNSQTFTILIDFAPDGNESQLFEFDSEGATHCALYSSFDSFFPIYRDTVFKSLLE